MAGRRTLGADRMISVGDGFLTVRLPSGQFVQFTETATCTGTPTTPYGAPGLVMDYYDGNTVTGLWNYAQNHAMSDNNYDTTFGPSTPGALNLISGNDGAGYAVCGATHQNTGGNTVAGYSPHHEPFQYYKSTANPKHLPPGSESAIGHADQANHQYDISDFYATLSDGNMPAVSFLKAAEYQDGHPGYSDPLDEQNFLVNTINQIEQSKFWRSTAIVVTWDDSDGWYDHQPPVIVNGSNTSADTAICTSAPMTLGSFPDRCGYSQRLPLLVISPWTRQNHVSDKLTDTASVTSFIEDNWLRWKRIPNGSYDAISGRLDGRGGVLDFFTRPHFRPVILSPSTGEVMSG
jgi:phospholipase C